MAFQLSEKTPCGTGTCATIHSECNPLDNAVSIIKTTLAEINATGAKEKTLTNGISSIKDKFNDIKIDLTPVAKEATLLAKVAELKEALNTIDFTAIEQAIQDVEDVTAKEATLIQGVEDIIKAVENIDFTDLENSIAEVKDAVANIDFSALAKEETLLTESQAIQSAIQNIDLSSIESKVEEVGSKIDNIDLSAVENKVQEESAAIQGKIDNIKLPEIDTAELAKQGENAEATNTAIYNAVKSLPDLSLLYAARAEKNNDGENTYSIVLPVIAKVVEENNGVVTIQL